MTSDFIRPRKMEKVQDLWVLNDLPPGVGAGTLFKYVILGKPQPRWENRGNRNWREVEAPVVTHIWDSTQWLGRGQQFFPLFKLVQHYENVVRPFQTLHLIHLIISPQE